MPAATVLCRLGALDATGAKEIVLDDAGIPVAVVVVRCGAGVAGYFNSCPHAKLPLNRAPDVFFDAGGTVLVCVNHGAHFDAATGRCLRGPCKGASLRPFPVRLDGDLVVATDTDYSR